MSVHADGKKLFHIQIKHNNGPIFKYESCRSTMVLNPKEIKSIQNDLIKMYGKKMVEVDKTKKGVTTLAPVLGSSQVQRIKLLKEVQKSFAFM